MKRAIIVIRFETTHQQTPSPDITLDNNTTSDTP